MAHTGLSILEERIGLVGLLLLGGAIARGVSGRLPAAPTPDPPSPRGAQPTPEPDDDPENPVEPPCSCGAVDSCECG